MTLGPLLAGAYLDRALSGMATTLECVTDEDLATSPFGAATTSVSGLVTHATEVCEFW